MTYLSALNLIPQAAGQATHPIMQGQVANNPASFADELRVTLPGWHDAYYFSIPAGEWPACHGRTLPQQGDLCVLLVDDQRKMWCVLWAGTTTYPTGPVTA